MSFINPYNFVPLTGECEKKERLVPAPGRNIHETLYTGILQCALTTLTPLFIPNTTNDNAFKGKAKEVFDSYNKTKEQDAKAKELSKSFDFYSYADIGKGEETVTPIIPGSSIRGVVRSVYETITNSCMSTVGGSREIPLYRRSPAKTQMAAVYKTQYGLIENGVLYEADKYVVKTTINGANANKHSKGYDAYLKSVNGVVNNGHTGDKIKFDVGKTYITEKRTFKSNNFAVNIGSGRKTGYYLRGDYFETKHFDAIMSFKIINQRKIVVHRLTNDDNARIKTLLTLYKKDKDGVNQTKKHYEYTDFNDAFNENRILPVYYSKVPNSAGSYQYYISPACVTKEVYERTISSILHAQGDYDACNYSDSLCEACHLFGMVGTGENAVVQGGLNARSSRLQFRDAIPSETGNYLGNITILPILSSPKVSSTEFYMEQPDQYAETFNYDYKISARTPRWIDSPRLRGRKYYWHSDPKGTNIGKKSDEKILMPNERNLDSPDQVQIIRPVLDGKSFIFSVAFERLTLDELQKLCYAISLGANHEDEKLADINLAHKLGHGKPVGYGSVKIRILTNESKVFSINNKLQLIENPLPAGAFSYKCNNTDFMALANKNPKNRDKINYPFGEIDGKPSIYNWFILNKQAQGGSSMNPKFAYVLPKATDNDVSLPVLTKHGDNPVEQEGRKGNRKEVWESFHPGG